KLSRSTLLASGAVAAAGLPLGQADAAAKPGEGNALELVFKVDHVGEEFTAYGYLTHIAGIAAGSLFASGEQSERTAHFTVHSVTHLQGRSILDAAHVIAVSGPLEVYYRS